jgi:hypothetical protein
VPDRASSIPIYTSLLVGHSDGRRVSRDTIEMVVMQTKPQQEGIDG